MIQEDIHNSETLVLTLDNGLDEDGETWMPEGGESVVDNWVFRLYIPNLSDHIYWAVVDQTGARAAYNYGFN